MKMIIKRVKLENYRSHSNTTVDFSKGVNLILGKNGKGKTSILEAISSVMFNTKDRSGKETGKNFIKFGEKSGKIEVEFTANDGRDYIFKTEFFKSKPKKQSLTDINGLDCEGDIQENLEELCGIKKGFEETYENIVIAKQNEFINIFKAKPKDREEIFNKIFNTQIYKEMYDGFLKEATDKYTKQIDYLSKDINSLKDNMEDKEEISNFLKDEEVLKESAIKSIKAGEPVWFGCDVIKFLEKQKGIMDLDMFLYDDIFPTLENFTKAERLDYHESVLTHAMVFTGVNLDENGKPLEWQVENSWGDAVGDKGIFSMTDEWFDEYNYEVMVDKKYVDEKWLNALDEKTIELEPWDPFGALARLK